MFGNSSITAFNLQTPENKVYILKLIAHQKLGAKWIYYRKIKRGDQGLSIFREKSLMEQMKATRAALRFTTKNARKLYRMVYLESIKEIKTFTGIKTEFPELPEGESGEEPLSLNSEHDAVIISWTPIKFLLPILQLRAKGLATQRHTEGLAAKLFFKVAGYYADPTNWDRYKLNLYLRRITKGSTYQEIVSELEPLKNDLDRLVETYEPFKFGKASLSKDVAMDSDAFDDAMGVESYESQLNTLYWYHFIYLAFEQFLFKYYLQLIISTVSQDAIKYLTQIFEPILQKAIETRNVFLGSFETDRTKHSFRVPYQRLVKEKTKEPLVKNIKTQMGVFETYTYNLSLLDKTTLSYELETMPEIDSEWGTFVNQFILNIGRPIVVEKANSSLHDQSGHLEKPQDVAFEKEKNALNAEKEKLFQAKNDITKKKEDIKQRSTADSQSKEVKIELEEQKTKLLNDELNLDKDIQKLKEKFKHLENKQKNALAEELENQKRRDSRFVDTDVIVQLESELSQLQVRQYVLMNILNTILNCNQYKRQARYKILERFKERAKNDQELEVKRIEEIRKKAEKKLRELKKRVSKMDRLKQQDTVNLIAADIKNFELGIEERIDIIKKDSLQQLRAQKQRLNSLFEAISKEKSVNLGEIPKQLWKLIQTVDQSGEFIRVFPLFISNHIQSNYTRELEPFYRNIFGIFDLSIRDKLLMIQSIEKSGVDTSVKLILGEEEDRQLHKKIDLMKSDILKQIPELFSCKIIFFTKLIPINDLFELSIDNRSLNTLLLLKLVSPKVTQNFNLKAETIKSLLDLNNLINPLPKYNILQSGKEKEKSPEKRINTAILTSLLGRLESQS